MLLPCKRSSLSACGAHKSTLKGFSPIKVNIMSWRVSLSFLFSDLWQAGIPANQLEFHHSFPYRYLLASHLKDVHTCKSAFIYREWIQPMQMDHDSSLRSVIGPYCCINSIYDTCQKSYNTNVCLLATTSHLRYTINLDLFT